MDKGANLPAILLCLGVTQIIGYGTLYYAFAVLVPDIAREFAMGEPVLFAIFSAGLLAAGFAAPWLGRWMDANSAPKAMAAGSGCAAAVCAGLALAPDIWTFGAFVIALEFVSLAVLYDAAFASLAAVAGSRARRAITILTLNGRGILQGAGKVTRKDADAKALAEFEKYRIEQDRAHISDFDRSRSKLLGGKPAKKGKSK